MLDSRLAPAAARDCATHGDMEGLRNFVQAGLSDAQLHNLLQYAANAGQLDAVRWLMTQTDPFAYECSALGGASRHGHLDCVKLLWSPRVKQRDLDRVMELAVVHGQREVMLFLWPQLDASSRKGEFLCMAASQGQLGCVKALLDMGVRHPDAIRYAAKAGHHECLLALLPFGDPKHDRSCALMCAALHNHIACQRTLLPLSNPTHAWEKALVSAHDSLGVFENLAGFVPVSYWRAALNRYPNKLPGLAQRLRAHEEKALLTAGFDSSSEARKLPRL